MPEKIERFYCKFSAQSPIFLREGKFHCGRMGGFCSIESLCPYKEAEGEVLVICPMNPGISVKVNLESKLIECQAFRKSTRHGGCISGGCLFLGPNRKNECIFETTGQINSVIVSCR